MQSETSAVPSAKTLFFFLSQFLLACHRFSLKNLQQGEWHLEQLAHLYNTQRRQ